MDLAWAEQERKKLLLLERCSSHCGAYCLSSSTIIPVTTTNYDKHIRLGGTESISGYGMSA
jgi:hypothetical protein